MFWNVFVALCEKEGTKPNPLGKQLGISSGSLSRWKNENVLPSAEYLILIADHFGCSVDYLLGRSKVRSNELSLNQSEISLIERLRKIDEHDRNMILSGVLGQLDSCEAKIAEKGMGALGEHSLVG